VLRRSPRPIAALVVVAVTCVAFQNLPRRGIAGGDEPFVPRPEVARAFTFGFDALVSDFYWLQAVQIVGRALVPSQHAAVLGQLIDVVTTVDPWVDHPYRFAAVWLTDSIASVEKANEILERGIVHHPDDWRNRFHLGFNHFFYLADEATAADVLEKAAAFPDAPLYLSRLVARLRASSGSLETAGAFLLELIQNSPDPYTRAEYEKALDEVETERRARFLDEARQRFQQRNGRDIRAVEELAQGPDPILRAIPPEPNDWEWTLDPESGRIVSSYYRRRYEPALHASDRERRERWLGSRGRQGS
jgi:hypothetical protein